MSEVKWTKGKWRHDGTGWIVSGTKPVCVLDTRSDTCEADCNLIAAAPELYEALEEFLASAWDGDPKRQEDCPLCVKARAAMAKARGEQP